MDVFKAATEQGNIEIYRFVFAPVKSNMYCILSKNEAIIIDPHESNEGYELLSSYGVNKIKIFLTHEHYDHCSGVNWFQNRFESELVCHIKCAEHIKIARNNRPLLIAFVLSEKNKKDGRNITKEHLESYQTFICQADTTFNDDMIYDWNGQKIYFKSSPGHSPGSCCLSFGDSVVFTGDSLLKDDPVITRFPGGSSKDYNARTIPYLNSLKNEVLIMPGHGDPFYKNEVVLKQAQ